jgi:hypothetical protein
MRAYTSLYRLVKTNIFFLSIEKKKWLFLAGRKKFFDWFYGFPKNLEYQRNSVVGITPMG